MTELSDVRTAQPEDEDAVIALCKLLHEENGVFGWDADRVRQVVRRAWSKDNVIIGCTGPIGEPTGCVCLYVTECWYSGQASLEELFNFVHPDHRPGALHAKSLTEFAKRCSDALEIPLTIGVISNKRTEAKIRLYRRFLGEPAGNFFVYNRHFAQGDLGHSISVGG